MKTYSVFVEKGGTGKTVTVLAMLSYFNSYDTSLFPDAVKGKRALAIDFDPQMTMTRLLGAVREDKTIVEVLTDECDIKDAIVHVDDYGDIIPCKKLLAGLAPQLHGDALTILKDKLDFFLNRKNYIIIENIGYFFSFITQRFIVI